MMIIIVCIFIYCIPIQTALSDDSTHGEGPPQKQLSHVDHVYKNI